MRAATLSTILLAVTLVAACEDGTSSEGVAAAASTFAAIGTVRAFSLGGEPEAIDTAGINGDIRDEVFNGQIAVLGLIPDTNSPNEPIVMMPGFALGATIYLETPDGREGWAMNAVRRGHPVYLVDPAHSARAGFNPDPYTAAQSGDATDSPVLFSWGRQHVWTRWGLGPEYPQLFADSRFPPGGFDAVVRAYSSVDVGEIAGPAMIQYQLEANVSALRQLVDQIGPSVLLVHSASGVAAFELARREPESVVAVINVEPVGCPTENLDSYLGVAVLSVFGDYMEVRPQMPVRRNECQTTVDYLAEHGTAAMMFDLPEMGIRSNSHLPMSEDNSAELMTMILDWLDESI